MSTRFLQPSEIRYGNPYMRVRIRFVGANPRTIERGPTGATVRDCLRVPGNEKIRVIESTAGYEIKCMWNSREPKTDEKFFGITSCVSSPSGHIIYTVEPGETSSGFSLPPDNHHA
jgi:hypothetical protein